MRTPTLRECHQFIRIDDVRTHPRTEPDVAATATGGWSTGRTMYGVTVEALVTYVRTEVARRAAKERRVVRLWIEHRGPARAGMARPASIRRPTTGSKPAPRMTDRHAKASRRSPS